MKYKKYLSTTLILFLISCTSTQNSNNKLYELIISAEGGDINAQNEVAQAYYFGKMLERNELEGCKWAIKYAQNKESNNQTTIMLAGMCHKFGKLGNKDYFEARFHEAADERYMILGFATGTAKRSFEDLIKNNDDKILPYCLYLIQY